MKLIVAALLLSSLAGCCCYPYPQSDYRRISDARQLCAWRGYPQIRIEYYYDRVDRIYCSMEAY